MEWISVEDRLPETEGWKLCYSPDFGIDVLDFSEGCFCDENGDVTVTHWMPLPDL